ncbi:hypothetical protein LAZ67_9003804 [Cordylochernes scorpioides]|uniref:Transposase n=1 Tax=Cordylochernes scorpioides TaxID=51811 RepID=A0ABY6KXF0_9ARAC|nr:hypothetical protein LAZ67_9003804 [Cordylochernes scorpioides]
MGELRQDYFIGKRNVIYERAKFNRRSQGETEPVEEFITNLYVLAENCSYGILKEEMIRDRIIKDGLLMRNVNVSDVDITKDIRKNNVLLGMLFATSAERKVILPSPRYSQSNGFIESFVKIVKERISKSKDPYLALLAYRATPLANGFSPAELSMGRRVRTTIPTPTKQHQPPNLKNLKNQEAIQREKQKYHFDRAKGVRELPPLDVDDRVWLTDLKTPGVIISKADTPRSYMVDTPRGREVLGFSKCNNLSFPPLEFLMICENGEPYAREIDAEFFHTINYSKALQFRDAIILLVWSECSAIILHRITISRRLVANGLHSCRPLRRLPLTPPNRRQRLEWCRARSTWMTEWHRVVFSDESRFCLSSDSRRVRVWRGRGERSNPAAIVERPTVRQRGIMVWGAIAYDSRSPLLRIQGTMTAQRYVDDVLRPVTLPYLQGVPNALYQQDNARPHTARISQQALQDVQMLPWPPYSPDLSPIEHVWDIIGRRLHALPQPRSEDELWQMVEREWRAIPQDAIRTLIDSLPRRVAACIAVRGGPTCY